MSELPERNGWSIARHAGDRTPDKTQRLLNHASWDTFAAMAVVRRFAVAGLEQAARRGRRAAAWWSARSTRPGRESRRSHRGSEKAVPGVRGPGRERDQHRAPVVRARKYRGHALIGARQWIPREHLGDPVKALVMGLPADLEFRTKGQLATGICASAYAGGIRFDFACGDEVYGNCTQLSELLREARPGVRAARAAGLHPHPGRGHEADLRGSGQGAAEAAAALGGAAPPAAVPKASAGTPGHGSPPSPRAITCWSAAT